MAEHVLPQHMPHEQLRTEAPKQKAHTDKYVSAFVTGKNATELTFQNPILNQSADHFKVGIDDLTVNLGNLSMLDFSDPTEVLLRIKRRGVTDQDYSESGDEAVVEDFLMPDYVLAGSAAELERTAAEVDFAAAPVGSAEESRLRALLASFEAPGSQRASFRDGFEFKVDRVFNALTEIMDRFREIALSVSAYANKYGLLEDDPNSPGHTIWNEFQNGYHAANQNLDLIQINLTGNGQLEISASRVFWANFVIEVPLEKYRQILFKDPDRRTISLHPGSGALEPNSNPRILEMSLLEDQLVDAQEALLGNPNDGGLQTAEQQAQAAVDGATPGVYVAILIHDWDRNVADASTRPLQYVGSGMLFSTIDRRVTLEIGCSLPIKNSPLIDHGVESPDYVLGRYMFHKPYTIGVGNLYSQSSVGVQTIQGARDRIVFHHLRPQQKIQTLRLRLWVRVRKYDTTTKKWNMETIMCPIDPQDYWHIRLQFVSKN